MSSGVAARGENAFPWEPLLLSMRRFPPISWQETAATGNQGEALLAKGGEMSIYSMAGPEPRSWDVQGKGSPLARKASLLPAYLSATGAKKSRMMQGFFISFTNVELPQRGAPPPEGGVQKKEKVMEMVPFMFN